MAANAPAPRQQIRFCRSVDGTQIAYAVHGSGPPLVVDSCWLSHLQHDWSSPVWRHHLLEWGREHTVVRFDERGHGLSDRDITDHGLEVRVADLEAVVDDAGLERFDLLAMAQGGPVAISYTARHPQRSRGSSSTAATRGSSRRTRPRRRWTTPSTPSSRWGGRGPTRPSAGSSPR
ncbi:alpha/beta fold hydrolase [Janibacter melonis]|uniref:alpha/beta fold hydrolase n=1 Tax=Janibacter melonis TaxID=262209 RepID=UPI001CD87D6C